MNTEKEKLYTHLQYFYENCNENLFESVSKDFIEEILDYLFYNISGDDLEKLAKSRRTHDYELKFCCTQYHNAKSFNAIEKNHKIIEEIENKYKDKLLKLSYELFESVIY